MRPQTHALLLFYTLSPSKRFSISIFGGPQYSDIGPQFATGATTPAPSSQCWKPAGGASATGRGKSPAWPSVTRTWSQAAAGLIGAVQADTASASFRQQLGRIPERILSGGYMLRAQLLAACPRRLGSEQRAHDFGNSLPATAAWPASECATRDTRGFIRITTWLPISDAPDTNREFVSLSYQFSRPLGR